MARPRLPHFKGVLLHFLVQSFRFYLAVRLILIEFLTAKWLFYPWQHTFEVGKEGFGKLIH